MCVVKNVFSLVFEHPYLRMIHKKWDLFFITSCHFLYDIKLPTYMYLKCSTTHTEASPSDTDLHTMLCTIWPNSWSESPKIRSGVVFDAEDLVEVSGALSVTPATRNHCVTTVPTGGRPLPHKVDRHHWAWCAQEVFGWFVRFGR